MMRSYCYKLVQGFRVTFLFIGQYNTKGYDTVTDVILKVMLQLQMFYIKGYDTITDVI